MVTADMPAKIPELETKPSRGSRSIYVATSVWERLAQIAAELGRSRSSLVAGILRDWVRDYDSPEPKKAKKN